MLSGYRYRELSINEMPIPDPCLGYGVQCENDLSRFHYRVIGEPYIYIYLYISSPKLNGRRLVVSNVFI